MGEKKITIVFVCHPSVFVDDGSDSFAMILAQNSGPSMHFILGVQNGHVQFACLTRPLFL